MSPNTLFASDVLASTTPHRNDQQKRAHIGANVDEVDGIEQSWSAHTDSPDKIPPGSFVELRRSVYSVVYLLLASLLGILFRASEPVYAIILADDKSSPEIVSMDITGSLHYFLRTDIQFAIPHVVDAQLAERCYSDPQTTLPEELEARRQVLKALRPILIASESEYVRISSQMATVHDRFRSEDPTKRVQITTAEAARVIIKDRTSTIPPITLLAVHQHLMARSEEFTADWSRFLTTQRFWVRSLQSLEDIRAVEKMVVRNEPSLQSFIHKSRRMVDINRRTASNAGSRTPSLHPCTDLSFSPEELRIVRFLREASDVRRFIQRNPYLVATSSILRQIKEFDALVEQWVISEFLVELGLVAPWDDLVVDDLDLSLRPIPSSTEHSLCPTAQSSSPILRSMGPQDFYPDDPAASVRHDFGRLPVYVVDDADAEELDDGFSIEPVAGSKDDHWIHVHIANPSSLIPPTHDIARTAHRMAETQYFPLGTRSMLPRTPQIQEYSLGYASAEGRAERVMTSSFRVDEQGAIKDYKVRFGLVRNVQRLQYDDVDAGLGIPAVGLLYPFGGAQAPVVRRPLTPEQVEDMKKLFFVAKKLTTWRIRQGALMAPNSHAKINVEPKLLPMLPRDASAPFLSEGFPKIAYSVEPSLRVESGTRQVVAEYMKASSRVVSMVMRDRGLPALRRTMDPWAASSEKDRADLFAMRDELGFVPDMRALFCAGVRFESARYSSAQAGHSSLGIPDEEGYVHSTSPLRRFVDMLMHWQLGHSIISPSSRPLFGVEWMKACASEMTAKAQAVKRASTTGRDFWALKFIQQWMDHPEKHAGLEDPLQSLVAIPSALPRQNLDGTFNSICVVPSLGLRATIYHDNSHATTPGVPVDVNIQSVRFGNVPRLLVTPK